MEMSRAEDLSILRAAFDRARAVHVGIDIQNFYCDPKFGNPHDTSWYGMIGSTVEGIDEFTAQTRDKLPPVWVNQTAFGVTAPDLSDYGPLRGLAVLAGGLLSHLFTSKAHIARREIYGHHARAQDDVVGKPFIDGFERSSLDSVLRRKRAEALVLTGFFADQCVKATAKGALRRGYEVFVAADLTQPADYMPEDCWRMLRAEGIRVVKAPDIVALCRHG